MMSSGSNEVNMSTYFNSDQVAVKSTRDIMCWRWRPPMDPWRIYSWKRLETATSFASFASPSPSPSSSSASSSSSSSYSSTSFPSLCLKVFLLCVYRFFICSTLASSCSLCSLGQVSSIVAKNKSSRRHPAKVRFSEHRDWIWVAYLLPKTPRTS